MKISVREEWKSYSGQTDYITEWQLLYAQHLKLNYALMARINEPNDIPAELCLQIRAPSDRVFPGFPGCVPTAAEGGRAAHPCQSIPAHRSLPLVTLVTSATRPPLAAHTPFANVTLMENVHDNIESVPRVTAVTMFF